MPTRVVEPRLDRAVVRLVHVMSQLLKRTAETGVTVLRASRVQTVGELDGCRDADVWAQPPLILAVKNKAG